LDEGVIEADETCHYRSAHSHTTALSHSAEDDSTILGLDDEKGSDEFGGNSVHYFNDVSFCQGP
jgi:hypothetical protein